MPFRAASFFPESGQSLLEPLHCPIVGRQRCVTGQVRESQPAGLRRHKRCGVVRRCCARSHRRVRTHQNRLAGLNGRRARLLRRHQQALHDRRNRQPGDRRCGAGGRGRRRQHYRPCSAQCLLAGEQSVIDAFASAIDALFADPNIGEDALWKAGGVGVGFAVRIIRKSPDRMAEFGDSRAVLPTVGIDIRRSKSAIITEGDLILIGAETYRISAEPMGDSLGLALQCEAAKKA
jgi:hypothetical protein